MLPHEMTFRIFLVISYFNIYRYVNKTYRLITSKENNISTLFCFQYSDIILVIEWIYNKYNENISNFSQSFSFVIMECSSEKTLMNFMHLPILQGINKIIRKRNKK